MSRSVERGRRGAPVKLSDVAKRVGVSPITISRALRNPEIVSADLREVILRTVEEMGYIPNLAARALAGRHNGIVGVITPALQQYGFAGLMIGIEDCFRDTEFTVQYASTLHHAEGEAGLLKSFLTQKPAGVIIAGAESYRDLLPLIESATCPIAHITDLSQEPQKLVVGLDHYAAGAEPTRFLLSRGYKMIGFVGRGGDVRSRRRLAGYEAAMRQAGLFQEDLVIGGDAPNRIGLGRELFSRLLQSVPDVDAVFAQSDELAFGVLIECKARGIRVPEDFGICGFNDLEFSTFTEPTLTTVHIPRYEIGYRVADLLLHAVRDETRGKDRVDCGFSIVPRGSTR
ncbi:LacI family DNA-binding transcriptional regulator [Rhizobium lentis]|uniref:LacI family DNA-binding transcriptional regulator n=1 Tax=Rhizobium lentis TaxID=1138194 RepID=UPI001A91D0B5|nr:LacI family DNA-binding transcriptional regulator [Rhizobium lentis]MBX4986686.1 LacI family DNA-binding transcriptional regulator [Rhizobium lentis]MBX5005130.1 LacI family DNA-binding transcriptional regulator [Rhizobium lentis]MBX5036406.1 LacI family DNA-binding transcriptional regulator [Rhizobium lentis]MBX5067392.1 LacI family DNA-binding transcriptional regulator [Rhizobium lentis]MBX5078159.1 LacI family DNA-binding transcriptional regulator [Rhizobium lentis]